MWQWTCYSKRHSTTSMSSITYTHTLYVWLLARLLSEIHIWFWWLLLFWRQQARRKMIHWKCVSYKICPIFTIYVFFHQYCRMRRQLSSIPAFLAKQMYYFMTDSDLDTIFFVLSRLRHANGFSVQTNGVSKKFFNLTDWFFQSSATG